MTDTYLKTVLSKDGLLMSELWKRIKAARTSAKLSQMQIGDACKPKISRNAVSLWETNDEERRTKPKYDNLLTVVQMTGVPIEWLLSEKSDVSQVDEVREIGKWRKVTGGLNSYVGHDVKKEQDRLKIDEILNDADRAIKDSGKEFTVNARVELYIEALKFSGTRDFPPEFVAQYLAQLLKEKGES